LIAGGVELRVGGQVWVDLECYNVSYFMKAL